MIWNVVEFSNDTNLFHILHYWSQLNSSECSIENLFFFLQKSLHIYFIYQVRTIVHFNRFTNVLLLFIKSLHNIDLTLLNRSLWCLLVIKSKIIPLCYDIMRFVLSNYSVMKCYYSFFLLLFNILYRKNIDYVQALLNLSDKGLYSDVYKLFKQVFFLYPDILTATLLETVSHL